MAPFLAGLFWNTGAEVWLEPFGGGAGAALTALEHHRVPEAWIVESNPALSAFWTILTSTDGERLARRVDSTFPTVDMFVAAKDLVASALAGQECDLFEVAFAAFLVNRCSRSGMIVPDVGPIGGWNQSGRWGIDARWHGRRLADRLRAVTALGSRFKVFAGDGIAFLEDLPDSGVADEVFVFADPPYIGVGNRLYAQGMDRASHQRLAKALLRMRSPWVLTYDNHADVPGLYPGCRVEPFAMPHTAGKRKVGTELLVLPSWLEAAAGPVVA